MTTPARRTVLPKTAPLGALVGAGVGLLVAKGWLPGLVLGAMLGHLFQRQLGPGRGLERTAGLAVERAAALLRMSVALARLDGEIGAAEREAIRSYFRRDAGLPEVHLAAIDRMIDAALSADERGELPASLPPLDAADRVHVLFVLFRIALADQTLHPLEETFLRQTAESLGLSPADYQGIRAHFIIEPASSPGGPGGNGDYAVLGLDPGAGPEQVKARYREAVRNYHPDRFQHLGDEFTSVAEEKFKRIHEAYERINAGVRAGVPPPPVALRLSVCQECRLFSPTHSLACPRCRAGKHQVQEGRARVRCPFCTQTNTFPESAFEGQVRCGNCKVLIVR